jgi:glutathione peroxidase-family protein
VYDKRKRDVMLAEVKMRRAPKETSVLIYSDLMQCYKEFWKDAILIIAIPCGQVLYAQRFRELETKGEYNADIDFEKFEDLFTEVNGADLLAYREKAIQAMKK